MSETSRGDRLRLFLALRLVALLRFLVPRRRRAAWHAEWRGELSYLSVRDAVGAADTADVLAHSLNAIPHATALRKHEWRFDMLLQDLRYAFRRLLNAPGFTLVAMLTVAIGVGANAAIFSVIDSTLLNPMPYPDADRLIFLWKQAPGMSLQTTPNSEDVAMWRERATSFEELHVYTSRTVTLTGGAEPRREVVLNVLPGFFDFLGAAPAHGREFSPDDTGGGERVVIIGHGLWQQRFGGADVLGDTIVLDGEPHAIVGVLPRGFAFHAPYEDIQVWLPLSLEAAQEYSSPFAFGRLKPGISQQAADEELAALAVARAEETGEEEWPGVARRPQDMYGSSFATSMMMLQAAVGIVLLIACANVANLLLTRGSGQRGELAVRAALGAARGRLFRQLLTEHVLLALGGGVLGYGLAHATVTAISRLRPEQMSSLATLRVDGWIFFFAIGVAALTGVLFGVGPALQVSAADLSSRLQRTARHDTGSPGRSWLRNGLVIAEVGLALLLLVGAGLLFSTLSQIVRIDVGFETENALTLSVNLPAERYPDDPQRLEFRRQLEERIRGLLGERLEAMGASAGALPTLGLWFGTFASEGEEPIPAFTRVAAHSGRVAPGFFEALGVELVAGRYFTSADVDDPGNPIIVNANWARQMWGDADALGRRVRYGEGDSARYYRVVGVIEDALLAGRMATLGDLQIFRPLEAFSGLTLVVRTREDPRPSISALKQLVWDIDPDLPVEDIATLDDRYAARLATQRFNATLLGVFAGVALVLALIGVYGVLSYSVGSRTREIGIRMALGARRGNVLPMVVWQGMRLVLVGVVVGLLAAVALTRFIESLLYEVSPIDPWTYGLVTAALVLVAALACLVPAWRAARLDAMEALRH